jgi:hypothetical protein
MRDQLEGRDHGGRSVRGGDGGGLIFEVLQHVDVDYYLLLRVDPEADALTIRKAWAVEQRLWGCGRTLRTWPYATRRSGTWHCSAKSRMCC